MAPKELTRQQVSSRLSYSQNTPAFLQKLQNKLSGRVDDEEDEDNDFEDMGTGRPPIPRRPAIPERPVDEAGSADEDDGEEKPQVVVLKKGKHFTEWEAENIRRHEKGLLPIPDPNAPIPDSLSNPTIVEKKEIAPGLSFSSSKTGPSRKRKLGDSEFRDALLGASDLSKKEKGASKKKAKRNKTLLSFGDET